jgi:Ca2+-binding RTX toxin-like protein
MSSKIYTASFDVFAGQEHMYLFYDSNIDNDNNPVTNLNSPVQIIRGGRPENHEISNVSNNIVVELRTDATQSVDWFEKDGVTYTPTERNFREIASGTAADNLWSSMWSFADSLGEINIDYNNSELQDTGIEYNFLGPNSNSVINSVLNANGINLRDTTILPYADGSTTQIQNPSEYPGHMAILDGSGDDTFTAYAYSDAYEFYDSAGSDLLIIDWQTSANITKDTDMASSNSIVLKGFDNISGVSPTVPDNSLTIHSSQNTLFVNYFDDVTANTKDAFRILNSDASDNGTDTIRVTDDNGIMVHQVDARAFAGWDIQQNFYNTYTTMDTSHLITTAITSVTAGSGDDYVFGMDSFNDTLIGGLGDDHLYGGAGNDVYRYNLGDGDDVISDASGTYDQIIFGANITPDMYRYQVSGNDAIIRIVDTQENELSSISIIDGNSSGKIESIQFESYSLVPEIAAFPVITINEHVSMQYTSFTSTLTSNANEYVSGNGFDNIIKTGLGSDIVYSGAGDDRIYLNSYQGVYYNTDSHIVYAGSGDDVITGGGKGTGVEYLFGEDGNDNINSSKESYLDGGNGDDRISASFAETNYILGGAGNDIISAGAGNDIVDGGTGNDTIISGDGSYDDGDDIVIASSGHDTYSDGYGYDIIKFTDNTVFSDLSFYMTNFGRDLMIYKSESQTMKLLNFNVSFRKYELIEFSNGTTFDLTALDTSIYGTSSNDTLVGSDAADDKIYGYAGDDYIYGRQGLDYLYGGQGMDRLYGQAGNDYIYGEDGDDILSGGDGDDRLYGQNGNDHIEGDEGNDKIYGLNDDDSLFGGDGNDELRGGSGIDYLHGNNGNDRLYGDNDNDTLSGDGGNDRLYGGSGDDMLYGDADDDILYGGDGFDNLDGGTGNDTMYGDAGNDIMTGRAGDDIMYGGDNDDALYAHEGNDTLYGDGGIDYLQGMAGDDILNGGDGYDRMTGGDGADTFVFEGYYNYDNTGFDRVYDFDLSENDVLDVSEMLSAYDPLNDTLSDFINISGNSSRSYIQVDADGAGTANQMATVIRLDGINLGNADLNSLVTNGNLIVE